MPPDPLHDDWAGFPVEKIVNGPADKILGPSAELPGGFPHSSDFVGRLYHPELPDDGRAVNPFRIGILLGESEVDGGRDDVQLESNGIGSNICNLLERLRQA